MPLRFLLHITHTEMSKYASALQQQQLAILRQHSAQLEQQAAATAAAAAAAASDITNVNPAAKDDFMTAAGEEPVSNAIEIVSARVLARVISLN